MLNNPKISEINRQGLWPLLVGLGVGAVTGYFAYKGAGDAADAQERAADQAAQVTWDMYAQGREDLAPWRAAGKS